MNGMSENVSRTFSHFDFPRVMSHAIGTPVMTSRRETSRATVNEFLIASSARAISFGRLRTSCIVSHLMSIPSIGGNKINAKKIAIAVKYTPYLTAFLDESLSQNSLSLGLCNCFSADSVLQLLLFRFSFVFLTDKFSVEIDVSLPVESHHCRALLTLGL